MVSDYFHFIHYFVGFAEILVILKVQFEIFHHYESRTLGTKASSIVHI